MKKPFFTAEIKGRPVIKKNTKKVFRRHGTIRVVYSKQFTEWERWALLLLKCLWKFKEPFDKPIEAKFEFHFVNRAAEADVSNLVEAPQDALQKAGVIVDDRLIQVVHAQKYFGAKEPYTKIELYEI